MFTTYYSDSLEILALIGGRIMKEQQGGSDLFLNEVIVTQNSGMFTYVKQVMTAENGIFAQTRNVRLWNFVWELARAALKTFPQASDKAEDFDVYSREALRWNLIGLFSANNALNGEEIFQHIREYLDRPGISETERELLVYDLAASLADVYDKYQIYRSDWISLWTDSSSEGIQSLNDYMKKLPGGRIQNTFKWEAALWSILEKNVKGAGGGKSSPAGAGEQPRISRSRIIKDLGALLQKTDPASAEGKLISEAFSRIIPGRVFIYGISSVPPEILSILIALGRFSDVHFMFLNPCREYWGDIRPVSRKEIREKINRITRYQIEARSGNLRDEFHSPVSEAAAGFAGESLSMRVIPSEEREDCFKKIPEVCDFDFDFDDEAQEKESRRKADEELRNLEDTLQNAGNPLLLSFGKRGRDTVALLTKKTAECAELYTSGCHGESLICEISAYEQDYRAGNDPAKPVSILEKIRMDIFRLDNSVIPDDNEAGRRTPVNTENPSLTVTSCPTRLREVQVLYDRILALFDKDNAAGVPEKEPILPRDIIVMAPNISVYAPFIEGVFRGGSESLRAKQTAQSGKSVTLPIAICDRSMNDQNPVLTGVRTLLSLASPDRIWSAHDVVALFNIEEVRQKFGFSEEDIREIGNLLHDNNGVLGLDSGDVAALEIPEPSDGSAPLGHLQDLTLKQGVSRLVMGSMMPCEGSDSKPWNAESEGDQVRIIGSFAEFLTRLTELKKELSAMNSRAENPASANPLTMEDWHTFIRTRILDGFFRLGEQGTGIMSYLKKAFSEAAASIAALERKPRLTLSLAIRFFDDILAGSDDRRSPFLRNAINFCTFVPMRSIPFRYVFMLGMNDGEFPANPAVPGFDLMNEMPRAGDRNRPDDDRYMFLEAVLAAQEGLHISYLGISPGDGSEKNPSVVVSELADYVMASMRAADKDVASEKKRNKESGNEDTEISSAALLRKRIFFKAVLNPSDRVNYTEGSPFHSYQEQWIPKRSAGENTGPDSPEGRSSAASGGLREQHFIGQGLYSAGRLEPLNGRLEIPARDLLRFIKDPEKYFLTRKLGVSQDYSREVPAHEIFSFGYIQANDLLKDAAQMTEAERAGLRELQIRKGAFPAGMAGDYAWNQVSQKIDCLGRVLELAQEPLSAADEITLDAVPDYAAVCIALDRKLGGNPFVPSGPDWQYWDIPEPACKATGAASDTKDTNTCRDLLAAYRQSCGTSIPAVTIRITGISEVDELLRRNFMFDSWHNSSNLKFRFQKKVHAALYTLCVNSDNQPFYAVGNDLKEVSDESKRLEKNTVLMSCDQASGILRLGVILYLLGQIMPLSLELKNNNYSSNNSRKNSTRRDFLNAGKTLFNSQDNDQPRNFKGICTAFKTLLDDK